MTGGWIEPDEPDERDERRVRPEVVRRARGRPCARQYQWCSRPESSRLHRRERRSFSSVTSGASDEANDGFGSAVAVGDFNGDGYDDLIAAGRAEDYGAVNNGVGLGVLRWSRRAW